jgi:integrase
LSKVELKRTAAAVGLDPDRYAGHSLRAGMATSAAAGGASERDIMNQTGHRSAEMVRRYQLLDVTHFSREFGKSNSQVWAPAKVASVGVVVVGRPR